MKHLLKFLKPYTKESVLGPFFKLLEAVLELVVPLVMAAMIDRGIANSDRGFIVRMVLLLGGLGAAGLASSITAQYFAAKAAAGFGKEVKRALFAKIQSLTFSDMDVIGASTLLTRITSDSNQVQTGVNLTLRLLLRSPFIVFGAMLMAFTIDVKSALIFAAVIPVLTVVIFGLMLRSIPLYKRVQGKLDQILGVTRQNLVGARVIRAFGMEESETAAYAAANETLAREQKRVGRISALLNPATYVIINLAIAWLVWTGALRVEAGILTQGAVVALYNYMSQILVELVKLASLIITITKSVASGNRIQDILQKMPGMHAPELAPQTCADCPAVEFQNVGLRYHSGAEEALAQVSFAVQRGQTIGIIGGTGAGKSSLVNLIPRFYDASEGVVLVNGVDVRNYPFDLLRGKIGIVPQTAVLFSGTIRENLRWGRQDATDAQMETALETAQIKDAIAAKGGLDFVVEQGGKNLSGGQIQRLTIARALVREPEILILDDSASALDFATDAALRKAIRSLKSKPTVFIVSQRASAIQYADQIVVLEDGKVADIGTSEELLASCSVYREIYDYQFRKEGAGNG